jgi:L-rhamnose-H+ transport protein
MEFGVWLGAALVVAGGVLQGTFAVPMKYTRYWKHENIWLVFAATGLVLFPWALTAAAVPSLPSIYSATSWKCLSAIIGFGVGWGIGATLTGLGLNMLGIGLGFAIILGLSASIGSLVPLLVLTPGRFFSAEGYYYLAGTAVMLVGLVIAALAGSLRERSARKQGGPESKATAKSSFVAGLLVCIAAGILSSMLNFCFAFGAEAIENARRFGASAIWASNVAAAPGTTGGFLANAAYCGYMMRQNGSGRNFLLAGTAGHWLLGVAMGAFWYGGLAVYGIGINHMGNFGTVVGWPVLMGTIIVSSNVAGLVTGEWEQADHKARTYLFAGCIVILLALLVLAMAQSK